MWILVWLQKEAATSSCTEHTVTQWTTGQAVSFSNGNIFQWALFQMEVSKQMQKIWKISLFDVQGCWTFALKNEQKNKDIVK